MTGGEQDSPAEKSVWQHPQLGRFVYDDVQWVGTVEVPAFAVFTYRCKSFRDGPSEESRRPQTFYPLYFSADGPDETPSDDAAALAVMAVAAQEALVPKVVSALWEDLNGRGPDSGMWWHGGLDEFMEEISDEIETPWQQEADLYPALQLGSIRISPHVYGYEKPIAVLSFRSLLDEEHGVGILTDGHSIMGAGYAADVTPYKTAP